MNSGCGGKQLSKAIWGATVCGCFGVLLLASGCKKSEPPVDLKAAEQAVRDADAQWSKAAQAHDISNVLSFYAGGAIVLPPNEEMLTKKPDILKSWTVMLAPDVDLSWKPMWVEVCKAGDMAYIVGTYEMTTKVAKGKSSTERGKYLEVWKRQDDGGWKAEADTWNSDTPPPAKRR